MARKVAFIAPRLAVNGAVGGAETLLFNLAQLAAKRGFDVSFLTTCAKNHFTWANEEPAGEIVHEGIRVIRFPVNGDRDIESFLRVQAPISRGESVSDEDEDIWIRNNVNSRALEEYVKSHDFDLFVAGPYLFGLTMAVAAIAPERTILVPCLHDEAFARVRRIAKMFRSVRGFMFNTEPERELAVRLYGGKIRETVNDVVGFALPDFPSDAAAGRALVGGDYLLYCGRREPLKGTPILIDYWEAYRKTHPESKLKMALTGAGEFERPQKFAEDIVDLGFVSEQQKHDLMAGALAFCHASLNESLGIVLLESWLANRPVLVHAKGVVLTDQARRSNGGLWFRDFAEYSECVDLLLKQPELAEALGASGRKWTLANYSPESVADRLVGVLSR